MSVWIMTAAGWRKFPEKICVNHNNVEGVFRPSQHHVAAMINNARADRYCDAVTKYINGYHGEDDMYRQMTRLGDLHGAYGEKL